MAKEIFKRELVVIDFNKNIFKFYNIEVLSVGYNELQVITHQGKLGNDGRQVVHRTSKFKEAMEMAETKFNEKTLEGFVEVEAVKKKLGQVSKPVLVPKKKEFKDKEKVSHNCGSCGKFIPAHIYKKINIWGRNEGGWDKDINFVGYEKVLCIDCQFHYDIFKKKM